MLRPSKNDSQKSLFFSLGDSLDQNHPLYILAEKIDWSMFEREFSKFYSLDNGTPAKSIRLTGDLLILKHVRNLPDENLVEQWSENNYYQYFCRQNEFVAKVPCASIELVMFRRRIGLEGCELILKQVTINLVVTEGDAAQITSVKARLTGVANSHNFKANVHSGTNLWVCPVFIPTDIRSGNKLTATVRLLGVTDEAQKLNLDLTLSNGTTQKVESDVSNLFTNFNTNKHIPLNISANLNLPVEAGFGATITGWKSAPNSGAVAW